MPQQNDDLQIKWHKCLHETFFACDLVYGYAPHVVEKIEEVVNLIITYAKQWCDSLQEVARRFMEVIRPAFQKLSEAFNDLKDTCKDLEEKPVEKKVIHIVIHIMCISIIQEVIQDLFTGV